MKNQNKFEDYMNNVVAPWALRIVIFANLSVLATMVVSFIK
jgi:hypothetical protein